MTLLKCRVIFRAPVDRWLTLHPAYCQVKSRVKRSEGFPRTEDYKITISSPQVEKKSPVSRTSDSRPPVIKSDIAETIDNRGANGREAVFSRIGGNGHDAISLNKQGGSIASGGNARGAESGNEEVTQHTAAYRTESLPLKDTPQTHVSIIVFIYSQTLLFHSEGLTCRAVT